MNLTTAFQVVDEPAPMRRMRFGSALAVLFLRSAGLGALFLARHSGAFTCLDESGAFVDFFAALKVRQILHRICTVLNAKGRRSICAVFGFSSRAAAAAVVVPTAPGQQ